MLTVEDKNKQRSLYMYINNILCCPAQMKEYKLNLRTKQCNVSTIDTPFRTKGVPADAKFLFEGLHGAAGIPNEYLVAMTFGGNTTDGGS